MRAFLVGLIAALSALAGACGSGDGDDDAPALSSAEQQEQFCSYFKAHRRESRQQMISGLIKVAPAEIKDDLRAMHGMNEPGYESSKRVQAYIAEHCDDPAAEFQTP